MNFGFDRGAVIQSPLTIEVLTTYWLEGENNVMPDNSVFIRNYNTRHHYATTSVNNSIILSLLCGTVCIHVSMLVRTSL